MTVRKLTSQGDVYLALDGDAFPTSAVADGSFLQVYSTDGRSIKEYIFDAVQAVWNPSKVSDQSVQFVADVGVPNQRHNRYMTTDVDSTHPGDDTTAIIFREDENVRRYRLFPISATAGELIKVCEDAANGTQADTWLTETNSLDFDVEFWMAVANQWSEWKEFSKDPDDLPLARIDFELYSGSTGPITEIIVEAE